MYLSMLNVSSSREIAGFILARIILPYAEFFTSYLDTSLAKYRENKFLNVYSIIL